MSIFHSWRSLAAACGAGLLLAACTPHYDWREVHGSNAPFTVLLPAKPATLARPVNLNGVQVSMTMTATEVGEVAFAVGSAELADAAAASAALEAMKTAMVNNIGGTIRQEKTSASSGGRTIDLEAGGAPSARNGTPLLVARFVMREQRVYQAIVLGPEKSIPREAIDTFFTSFKVD
jgi:hypothetical protein